METAGVVHGVAVGLLSVCVAVAAAVVSRFEWRPGALVLPWGLALSIAASAATVAVGRSLGRAIGFVAAGGWVVGAGVVVLGRPEGDYLIGADYLGYGFLLGATAIVIAVAGYNGGSR